MKFKNVFLLNYYYYYYFFFEIRHEIRYDKLLWVNLSNKKGKLENMLNTAEICCRRRRVMFKEAQNKKFETRAPGFLRQLKKKKKKKEAPDCRPGNLHKK